MTIERTKLLIAAGLIGALSAGQAHAQSATEDQIALLKKQLRALEAKLDNVQKQNIETQKKNIEAQKQSVANANAAQLPRKASPFPDVLVTMKNNRPLICTADGYNCVGITGRLHLDVAGYDYRPNSALTNPQRLNDGVNARRARVGVVGQFMRDFEFGLILDGGGTTDGLASLNQAYISYRGFRDLANFTIDAGYIDVPYTLDEATSSNNIMFLERASPNVIATSINAGDSRSAFGGHVNGDWWWAGAYVTGPATGVTVNHAQPQPLGATGRAVVVPINTNIGSLLLGADVSYLAKTGGPVGTNNLTLSDRIEVRVDPSSNALLSTGALANIDSALVVSGEAAAGIGSFYAQGEFYDYRIERKFGQSALQFQGGYGQASYVLTGESRKYNAAAGAYGAINPKDPFLWGTPAIGAWEIAGRFSYVDLDDTSVVPGARGGTLRNTTLGLNWYANQNVRFMFNWINGSVNKRDALNRDVGAKYDVFAVRTQFAF